MGNRNRILARHRTIGRVSTSRYLAGQLMQTLCLQFSLRESRSQTLIRLRSSQNPLQSGGWMRTFLPSLQMNLKPLLET